MVDLFFSGSILSLSLTMVGVGAILVSLGFLARHAPKDHRLDGALVWILTFVPGFSETVLASFVPGWLLMPGAWLASIGGVHIFFWKPRHVGGASLIRRVAEMGR
ncbi:MAG TPA: hypothetical protein VFG07_09035 [Thermoplasmata archaeon]|nr:hypothetical protein [Thermoplasmata archaeon]